MKKFQQICDLLLFFSFLNYVNCSVKSLSFLDHSLAEDGFTYCDLAILRGSRIFDEEQYGRAVIWGSDEKLIAMKSNIFTKSRCLILVSNENIPLNVVMDMALSLQAIKPVGVLYEVKDLKNASKPINGSTSFPLIIEDRGKSISQTDLPSIYNIPNIQVPT